MIKKNPKVKIIKKGEVPAVSSVRRKVKTSKAVARDMVSNVTGWVTDLKQRKSDETRAALDLLFSSTRRPSES